MLSFPGLRLRCLVPFVTPAAGPHQRHLLTHHQVIIRANTKQTDGSACTSSTPEPAKPGACGFDRAFRLLESSAILHALHGSQIKILRTPDEFFDVLKAGFRGAEHRLALATLYIGTGSGDGGDRESELLDELQSAAQRCRQGTLKEMSVLVDALRATRPVRQGPEDTPTSTALELSRRLLGDGVGDGEQEATGGATEGRAPRIGLWHTTALRGLLKRVMPARSNEALGVQHMKVYAWDDTVMVSGANLSDTYFRARQDRYVIFRSKPVADQVHALVGAVMHHSLRLGPGGELLGAPSGMDPLAEGSGHEEACRRALEAVMEAPSPGSTVPGDHQCSSGEGGADTWVAPVLQMGRLGIRQDEQCTAELLRTYFNQHSPTLGVSAAAEAAVGAGAGAAGRAAAVAPEERPQLVLSSPYLNLLDSYSCGLKNALAAGARTTVLTASSESHGWKGAKGIAGLLPAAYELLRHETFTKLAGSGASESGIGKLEMLTYNRDGWEFHAKGLWFFGGAADGKGAVTAVGSSNLGMRSAELDLELQFVVLTRNEALRKQLEQEVHDLAEHSVSVNHKSASPDEQRPAWYIPMILPWVKWLL